MNGPVWIHGIGFAAPGLAGWTDSRRVLRGEQPYVDAALPPYAPALLPPNERRRATATVRLAFRVAEEATAGQDASTLASVFASSDADMAVLHRISSAVVDPSGRVSPTDFHNSVHNAAAGYWGIAVGARTPSTTLAGHDGSFALGLLEATVQATTLGLPVLLVVFDAPAPEPLRSARPMGCEAACALVVSAQPGPAPLARLALNLERASETVLDDAALETLRRSNPALRALPLLQRIACGASGRVVLPCSGGRQLAVGVEA